MWLHYNGLDHKVINTIHIKRMLEDGAVEIPDPTAQVISQEPEQSIEPLESVDGSTEQQSKDEAPVDGSGESVEPDSKKPKRSTKA